MATDNRLRARLPESKIQLIRQVANDRDIAETDAERVLIDEGLASLGYRESPVEPADMLLEYARKIGTILGFVGLILVGYGIFGGASFRFVGFGLLLAGFGVIAGAEFAPPIKERVFGETA